MLRVGAAVLLFIGVINCVNGQNAEYNFDIRPDSRLIKSLGLNIPNDQAPVIPLTNSVPITTTRISTSRVLPTSYEPISAALYLQPPTPVFTTSPKQLTYLTVGDRPRATTLRTADRTATVLTVSDVGRRNKIDPVPLAPPPPASVTNEIEDGQVRPYSFEYEANDDQLGLRSSRSEKSDGRTVTGTYSYFDADGVYRVVEYVADENGFRANVKTNEPGTAKSATDDPANTKWEIESPPEAVVAKYLKRF